MSLETALRRPSQDIPRSTHGLWSLWDMLNLDARKFLQLMHNMVDLEAKSRAAKGVLHPKAIENLSSYRVLVEAELAGLELPVSVKVVQEMVAGAKTHEDFNRAIQQLWNTVALELDGRVFYGPLQRYAQYFEQAKLFGDDVFDKFPSANNDIFEAGSCLALERATACVMHLMRIVEVGLKGLAAALGVGVQNDWGAYLREIDKALEARLKAAGKRTSDEQFYAEVRVTLDGVRMAWRNPTMHIENNYSPERAEQILIAVRSLMQHLATKLAEPASP